METHQNAVTWPEIINRLGFPQLPREIIRNVLFQRSRDSLTSYNLPWPAIVTVLSTFRLVKGQILMIPRNEYKFPTRTEKCQIFLEYRFELHLAARRSSFSYIIRMRKGDELIGRSNKHSNHHHQNNSMHQNNSKRDQNIPTIFYHADLRVKVHAPKNMTSLSS